MMQVQFREETPTRTTVTELPSETTTPAKVVPVTSGVTQWLIAILYPIGRRLLMPFYFRRLQVTGQENLPKRGSVILAPTHRSRWDGLVMAHVAGKPVIGRDLRFMVSQDEIKGVQGWFIRRMGGFPINTKHPTIGTIRHSVEILRSGGVLVMFPEGNIFRHGRINPLKPGMARIALQVASSQPESDLKIVPISIRYSEPVPHWRCDAKVSIGTPLKVADYCTQSGKKSAQQLTNDLEVAMKNLDQD